MLNHKKLGFSMKRVLLLGALVGSTLALIASVPSAMAGSGKSGSDAAKASSAGRSAYYRPTASRRRAKRPVRVYITKRGGYSYSASDTFNTSPGDPRDPMLMLNRQTPAGPFDSGFFFDSPVAPRGGYSPYMH